MDQSLTKKLQELVRRDEEVRSALAATGALFDGYAEQMEQVHCDNAKKLDAILQEHAWPGLSLVGSEGCRAAWIIAQHAISRPAFQLKCLRLLETAVAKGEAPAQYQAMLEDRIRYNQGRPQNYGTILDWDRNGRLGPGPLQSPEHVDERRRSVGLPPIRGAVRKAQREAVAEGHTPPDDFEERARRKDAWSRRVGWR